MLKDPSGNHIAEKCGIVTNFNKPIYHGRLDDLDHRMN